MTIPDTTATFEAGDLALDSGEVLREALIVYRVIGQPDADRANCILLPTYYTGSHRSYDAMIGPGRALDPARWCILIANMIGNGWSTSPSHRPDGAPFPVVSIADNVRVQERLLREHLGITRLALAAGWSMGAMQAIGWAALFPDKVERLLAWCGAARCWPLNRVFLEGVRAALLADSSPGRAAGLRAFGRAYAGWAYSAAFFRDEGWRALGMESLDAFLHHWEDDHATWHAEDLLVMLETWRTADLVPLLPAIRARSVIMPCDTDAYFTESENRIEAGLIPGAELQVLRSDAGHCAGAPGRFPAETARIEGEIARLLALPAFA